MLAVTDNKPILVNNLKTVRVTKKVQRKLLKLSKNSATCIKSKLA